MRLLKHLVINIVLSSAILYFISRYVPELWLSINSEYKDVFVVFGVLWLLFWIINSVLKRILQVLTLPIKIFTLGISSLIINLLMFYFFEQFINFLDVGITVQLWSIIQTAILSVIVTTLYFLIKKLI